MDLLEIRKKAKKRKEESGPAAAVEPKLAPNSPAPKKSRPVEDEAELSATFAQDFDAYLIEQEQVAREAPVPVKKKIAPVAMPVVAPAAPAAPAPSERDLDLESFAKAFGHDAPRKQAETMDVDSAFLDLATEELYRHSYLDNKVTEEVELCELLSCMIANEQYGVNIHKIKEIIKMREITEVPRAPKFILGIITLRGRVIPIFDLRERLALEATAFSRSTKIVVVHHREELYGLIVDAVIDVARFPLAQIEATPQVMVGVEAKYIQGIGRAGNQMIILLNLEEVLSLEAVAA